MSEKFKAIVIDNQNEKFSREIKEINSDDLKDGNVLVKIDFSSLNYKDAMILKDGGKIVRKFPLFLELILLEKLLRVKMRDLRKMKIFLTLI